jgi:acyl-CoA dehydrogenase
MTVGAVGPFLAERQHEAAAAAAEFARGELAGLAHPAHDDAARLQARDLLARLGRSGLGRYAVGGEWGGALPEVDLRCCCLLREALAAASPLADAVFALQCLGAMPLHLAGSDAQRRRWLPRVAAGEVMTAFAMTEPEAGSDVGAIATRAARDGDGYLLDGRKAFISNAGIADLYVVFASTRPEAARDGLSCFLVPADAPGLTFAGPQVLSEPHPLGEITLTACRVAAADRLGEEGDGFRIGMQTLDRLRPTVAAAACGMAARALDEALAHARRRRQFGRALAEFQLVRQKLARMATGLAAARLLTYAAAWEVDGGEPATLSAAMAKSFATEAAQRIVDDAVQILGGRGVLAESVVDRLYRAVRALRIYEGTTEIQQLVIARELLRERSD